MRKKGNSLSVLIRGCQEDDLDAVLEVEQSSYGWPWKREVISNCIQPSNEFWVIEVEGTVAGYIICMIRGGDFHIVNLCVGPDFRGLGLARKLLNFSLYRARHRSTVRAFLEVRPSNKYAVQLYRSVGFVFLGIYKDYYPTVDGRENAQAYSKRLLYSGGSTSHELLSW